MPGASTDRDRGRLPQALMRALAVVVRGVGGEDPPQALLADDEQMIEAALAVYAVRPDFLAVPPQECQDFAAYRRSGVGGRRGINRGWLTLFRPPLPEPCVQLAPHTVLQWARSRAGQPSASRLLLSPPAARLVPFALCAAFPRSVVGRNSDDDYGTSVALGLAPGRLSRLPAASDVRAHRRCPVRPLQSTQCPPSARRRVRGPAVATHYPGGPASDALRGMCPCSTGDWGSSNPAFPVARGSREPQPYAPSGRARFPTMLLSPWLSPQGRVGDPAATFLRTSPRCTGDR